MESCISLTVTTIIRSGSLFPTNCNSSCLGRPTVDPLVDTFLSRGPSPNSLNTDVGTVCTQILWSSARSAHSVLQWVVLVAITSHHCILLLSVDLLRFFGVDIIELPKMSSGNSYMHQVAYCVSRACPTTYSHC